jgi:hypothetical protein
MFYSGATMLMLAAGPIVRRRYPSEGHEVLCSNDDPLRLTNAFNSIFLFSISVFLLCIIPGKLRGDEWNVSVAEQTRTEQG